MKSSRIPMFWVLSFGVIFFLFIVVELQFSFGQVGWKGNTGPWYQPTYREHLLSASQLGKWVLFDFLFTHEDSDAQRGKITRVTYTFRRVLVTSSKVILGSQLDILWFHSILVLFIQGEHQFSQVKGSVPQDSRPSASDSNPKPMLSPNPGDGFIHQIIGLLQRILNGTHQQPDDEIVLNKGAAVLVEFGAWHVKGSGSPTWKLFEAPPLFLCLSRLHDIGMIN